jgi:hypothetical protein
MFGVAAQIEEQEVLLEIGQLEAFQGNVNLDRYPKIFRNVEGLSGRLLRADDYQRRRTHLEVPLPMPLLVPLLPGERSKPPGRIRLIYSSEEASRGNIRTYDVVIHLNSNFRMWRPEWKGRRYPPFELAELVHGKTT